MAHHEKYYTGYKSAIMKRKDSIRFFGMARDCVTDEAGNVRSAKVFRLDIDGAGHSCWAPWTPSGDKQTLDDFRFTFLNTERAGLHVRIGRYLLEAPVDDLGYHREDPSFISAFKISRDGVFVLTPGFSFASGYMLDELPVEDEIENQALIANLESLYHFGIGRPTGLSLLRKITGDRMRIQA